MVEGGGGESRSTRREWGGHRGSGHNLLFRRLVIVGHHPVDLIPASAGFSIEKYINWVASQLGSKFLK